jgi:hypothetical protein
VVGCCFNPSHLPPERTLPLFRPIRRSRRARRTGTILVLTSLLAASGCRGAFEGFGAGARARTSADQLFAALSDRFVDVQRSAKYAHARRQIMKGSLSPSNVFGDSASWTATSGNVRLLEVFGVSTNRGYAMTSRAGAPAPRNPADARHVITLSRLGEDVYRWDTTVDFALGSVRPSDVAAVISGLIASAEGRTEREARAQLLSAAPRTSAALGTAFSLDSLKPTPLADGSTAVTLVVSMQSERLKRRYPAFGDYMQRYADPASYRVQLVDRSGAAYLDASARDRLLTIRVRTRQGRMIALAGPTRAMPDTLTVLADLRMKVKIFHVGFKRLTMEFVNAGEGESDRQWTVTARKEPEWDLPFASARLIRSPLRRPFAGEGALFRMGVRADPAGPTVLIRQARLAVQESAILKFLNSLGSKAMEDFGGKVEREEDAWLREVFSAMREDARVALRP